MAIRRIIHISDLHFSDDEKNLSLLQKEKYVDDFINSLKDIELLDTVVISGDIVDKGGSQQAYKEVDSFVQKLKNELGIKYFLCIPGNHDVSRNLLTGIKGNEGIEREKLWKYYDVKLQYFWEFIRRNNLASYKNTGLVSYVVLNDPNMVLLGLDSTDHIGISDQCGYINVDELKQAFNDIFGYESQKYKDFIKIAILHHRPVIYESGSQTVTENNGSNIGQYGTCDSENWKKVRQLLLEYDVHYVLTGHVHGSQSGQIKLFDSPNDEIHYSTVGSIGVDFSNEIKERLDPNSDKELLGKFEELICYQSLNGNHNAYNIWMFDDDGRVQEQHYKYIVDEGERVWCHWRTKNIKQTDIEDVFDISIQTPHYSEKEVEKYSEKILKCVRDNELYRTGHYHWKNTARLNWIDTSYFFQHREMMFYIARGINELIKKNKILGDVDCIMGLGIKGAILLSYVRFFCPNKKCSYLPENKKEYNEYETALFEGSERAKSFIVLTDVVHSGDTIKKFVTDIYDKNKTYLSVNVISIFDSTHNEKIANIKGKASITLFSLARLKVIDCQCGGENCDIYMNKLANVIEYKED